jgi:hypothetical protein
MLRFRTLVGLFLLAGCASLPDGFTMYPKPLSPADGPPANMSILLVGVVGPGAVDYLQFQHSSLPAINARFSPQGDSIVGVPLPVGLKQVALQTITLKGRPGFYIGGTAYGYIGVHTHKIDLDQPGIYYLATLDTSKPGSYFPTPIPEQLRTFRSQFGSALQDRKPVNFSWPAD